MAGHRWGLSEVEHMGSLIPFQFRRDDSDFEVRTLMRDGEPWFVGLDVATTLGYADPDKAVRSHCKALKRFSSAELAEQGIDARQPAGLVLIQERDVYRLVMRSRLPDAARFEEWVVGDVLPSIRKTGSYAVSDIGGSMALLERITIAVERQATAVEGLATDLVYIKNDVAVLKEDAHVQSVRLSGVERLLDKIPQKRANFHKCTVEELTLTVLKKRHGLCPACNEKRIVSSEGVLLDCARKDHFTTVNSPDAKHTWIICDDCHDKRHDGRHPHEAFAAKFSSFQQDRREVTGEDRQLSLISIDGNTVVRRRR
jgi:prophage antirepressor-like protein